MLLKTIISKCFIDRKIAEEVSIVDREMDIAVLNLLML